MVVNWDRRSFTKSSFIEAWYSSTSVAECARKLNLVPAGGTYKSLKDLVVELGLNDSHILGRGSNRGIEHKGGVTPRNLEDILIDDINLSTYGLKLRLIKEGLLEEKCSAPYCPLSNPTVDGFTGETVSLNFALDHINGNNRDNRLENLRLLCYHCHGQTSTYTGRNTVGKSYSKPKPEVLCIICNEPCDNSQYWHTDCQKCVECGKPSDGLRCKKCRAKHSATPKIEWPSVEELTHMAGISNYTQVGKQLGVSRQAVRMYIRRNT